MAGLRAFFLWACLLLFLFFLFLPPSPFFSFCIFSLFYHEPEVAYREKERIFFFFFCRRVFIFALKLVDFTDSTQQSPVKDGDFVASTASQSESREGFFVLFCLIRFPSRQIFQMALKRYYSLPHNIHSWRWGALLLAKPVRVLFCTLGSGGLIMRCYPHQLNLLPAGRC